MIVVIFRGDRKDPGTARQKQLRQGLHMAARVVDRNQIVMGRDDRDMFPLDLLFGQCLVVAFLLN